MEYSNEYLREFLPQENPPDSFVPGDVAREVASWSERAGYEGVGLVSRSVRWTYAIFSELHLGRFRMSDDYIRLTPPWTNAYDLSSPQISVGLYDQETEYPGFGICINARGLGEPSFRILGEMKFPNLERSVPIAIRRTTTELHSAPNPNNATTSCWAQCKATNQWGLITAGHAVGRGAGRQIPLDDGSLALSHRCFWQPVDAAFILSAKPSPPPRPLEVLNFPAAGMPQKVECKTGPQERTVVAASNTQGFYNTREFAVMYFIDQPFSAGDSGALVRAESGEACGIYVGSQPAPDTGHTTGRVQSFAQAMFALNTAPFA